MRLKQATLWNEEAAAFRDPAFMENRTAPVHRWVPWIAGFSAQFVDDVLQQYKPNNSDRGRGRRPCVLDPFAGVGTTLVQAMLRGCDVVGFEINPYAALVAETKLSAPAADLAALDAIIKEIEMMEADDPCSEGCARFRPSRFRSRIPFFSEQVERQVLRLLQFIDQTADPTLANVVRVAVGAVMVQVSNYTYEPSLSSRPAVGKSLIRHADVGGILSAKLRQMRDDIQWLVEQMGSPPCGVCHKVYCQDFLGSYDQLERSSVDLVVTSPPYLNNYHYVRNTRPQLYWLGMVTKPSDLRGLENHNFGKFWQTVRGGRAVELSVQHDGLQRLVKKIRSVRREAGPYGGPGWANYVATYFNDCARFADALRYVLANGAVAVIVIGNSIIQGIPIETDRMVGEICATRGLILERTIRLRAKRVGASITTSSVRCGAKSRVRLYENAVVVRKRS